MRPFAAPFLAAALALGAAACKSSPAEPAPEQKGGSKVVAERAGESGIRYRSQESGGGGSGGKRSGDDSDALKWATVPFENVVWLPWKLVGTGLKGGLDGIGAGFQPGKMPFLGLVFSPLNLAVGLVTGIVEGAAMSPLVIGPDDPFGRTMSKPTSNATNIWWYSR